MNRQLLVCRASRSALRYPLRHRLPIRPGLATARSASNESGENKSGHITCQENESILFFNTLLPFNLQWLYKTIWRWQKRNPILTHDSKEDDVGATSPAKVVANATKDGGLGEVEVIEVLPRLKEGGAFVKFKYSSDSDPGAIASAVHAHLKGSPIRPWWNPFASVRSCLVLGKPWVEDLHWMPSRRLRVEFLPPQSGDAAVELNVEQLYSFFRPYGKIAEIVSQASDSKVMPRFAYLDYSRSRKAILAKNVLHGYTIPEDKGGGKGGTLLRITYEKRERFGWIKDWIMNHTRIVIPLAAALLAGISIAVFDPLRTWSIRAHITRAFHVENNIVFKFLRKQSEDLIKRVKQLSNANVGEAGMQVLWDDRKAEIEQIQAWLMEATDTFIVVLGPRGSGKKELVIDHALRNKREAHKLLVIDCKPIQEARGDAATIAAAAAQVGYRPVFSWINNISGMLDLAAQGMTGMKAGFSETLENQLVKIHNNTMSALKQIALESRRKDDKDANLSDDEYLEAHPEHRPVVVVDNFLHKNNEGGAQVVYDKVAEWAAQLTTTNVAHVIFLTNDISFTKSLSKALPDRVFRQIALGDCSPAVAKRYVVNHLDFDAAVTKAALDGSDEDVAQLTPSQQREDLKELDSVISQLGGRLTDLEFFARRIKAGETPSKAVKEIIDQSASEILKMFLLSAAEDREWTSPQAWTLVRHLADRDSIPYNEILLAPAFSSSGDRAVAALEQAELITVQSLNGRPYSVKPGKPVYQPAFKRLVEDRVLAAKLDLAILAEVLAGENKSIDKYEQELHLLGELPKQPGELRGRTEWLLRKIKGSQASVEGYEKESAELKRILRSEY